MFSVARWPRPVAGLLLWTLLCFLPSEVAAQAIYGTVTGQVADDSGASVPGASVALVNEATGLKLEAVSDENGDYTIRNVTAGPYTLRASLQGFKEYVQTGIPVTPGAIVRVAAKLDVVQLQLQATFAAVGTTNQLSLVNFLA